MDTTDTARTSPAHTPGPWHVNYVDSKRGRIVNPERPESLGGPEHYDKIQIGSHNATIATAYRPGDAHLIAAAPALLAALETAKDVLESYHERCDWANDACFDGGIDLDHGHAAITDALAAIAQARGDAR